MFLNMRQTLKYCNGEWTRNRLKTWITSSAEKIICFWYVSKLQYCKWIKNFKPLLFSFSLSNIIKTCSSSDTPLKLVYELWFPKFCMLCTKAGLRKGYMPKKGDKSEIGNYKPVSQISCVGKTFERIKYKHVYNHIAEHSLL